MPNNEYVLAMARHNVWQNESLIKAANSIGTEGLMVDRGAFFGSIQQTFSHILWGDQTWLSRFTDTEAPVGGIAESVSNTPDWHEFQIERASFDKTILNWAHTVHPSWFDGQLSWFSGAINRVVTKPKTMLVIQLFNHQTHHRGQIHAMLTAAGAKPGDTDVPFLPKHYQDI